MNEKELESELDEQLEQMRDPEAERSFVEALEEALSKIVPVSPPKPNRHQRRKELAKEKKGGRGYTKSPKSKRRR
jgi:hypothetical protein